MRATLLPFAALLVPGLSLAGGTLGTVELDSLLAQRPALRDFLRSTLRLSDSAFAEVRLGSHFTHLGGARLGPYTISATSLQGGKPIEVVLCTTARFLDRNGKDLPENRIEEATATRETLTGVMLREEGQSGGPSC